MDAATAALAAPPGGALLTDAAPAAPAAPLAAPRLPEPGDTAEAPIVSAERKTTTWGRAAAASGIPPGTPLAPRGDGAEGPGTALRSGTALGALGGLRAAPGGRHPEVGPKELKRRGVGATRYPLGGSLS